MPDRHNLTIIQINDTHGYLEPHPELVWTDNGAVYPTLGGYPRIASYLAQARRRNPGGVIALDNGDTFHGTYPAVASRGEALIPVVNALRLDAMTAHWEFAWGPPHVKSIVARLDHPLLAVNCYDTSTGRRPFPASTIVERSGLRVGIIGIAATIIDKTMPPEFSEGVRFTLGVEELPDEIKRLRQAEGADLVILLSHLGLPQDVKLARQVSGIDLLLSGHTHNRLTEPIVVGGTPIIQSGCHGSFIGKLDAFVLAGRIDKWKHELVELDEAVIEDEAMRSSVDAVMAPYRAVLTEIVGHTEVALHRNTMLSAPMDDVLLAAVSHAAGKQIAFSNGWRYGAPIRPGPITLNDLWNIIPTNPPVSTVEMSGGEIRVMMEENLERTFAADPFEQMGGYLKRFRGLTIYGKLENPSSHRIERIFSPDGLLDVDRYYEVAFVTAQGVPAKFGRNRRHLQVRAIDALRNYLRMQTIVEPIVCAGRFIPV